MKKIMPQEIEVWYVIPALRRELAKSFVKDHKMNQKKAAEILGITEAAISQYLKDKRGGELKFTKPELEKIKQAASKVVDDPKNMMEVLYDLCVYFRNEKVVCRMHKCKDKTLPKNCQGCSLCK
ncbi:transcriptional regulator [Candidatus Pacearchaeota archaeon]|nr:transcriptional regulator [Candidatus Pacearchaeota archaeon]